MENGVYGVLSLARRRSYLQYKTPPWVFQLSSGATPKRLDLQHKLDQTRKRSDSLTLRMHAQCSVCVDTRLNNNESESGVRLWNWTTRATSQNQKCMLALSPYKYIEIRTVVTNAEGVEHCTRARGRGQVSRQPSHAYVSCNHPRFDRLVGHSPNATGEIHARKPRRSPREVSTAGAHPDSSGRYLAARSCRRPRTAVGC